jgi:hypothetical protein
MSDQFPTTLPRPPVATSDAELFHAIAEKHGGLDALRMADREIIWALTRAYAELRVAANVTERARLIEAVVRLESLLPAPAAAAVSSDGETFTSDAAISVFVVGELSDDDLLALAAGLREFAPNAETLAGLVERNVAVEGQLRDAQLALSMRDFVRLNEVLASVPDSGGRVDLVERLRRDLDALQREVEGLRGERVGAVYGRRAPGAAQERAGAPAGGQHANESSGAPRAGSGVPGAIPARPLTPAESADCQPPYAPGQGLLDALNPIASAPAGHTRFDYGGVGG